MVKIAMSKHAFKALALLGLGALMSLSAYALSDRQRAAIIERITPVGQVCVQGDTACGTPVAAAAAEPRDADKIYGQFCVACHSTGVGGAPILGNVAQWEEALAKGIEQVYANSITGIGAMPPMGTCMNCSEDEIRATVDYMVEQSR